MIQSIGARFAQGEVTLEYAQDVGCRACASPGGGCQFLGTAGTSQVVSEALGLAITHGALSPIRHPRMVRRRRSFGTRPRHGRKTRHQIQRHPHRRRIRKRNGRPRSMWRLHQSPPPHPRNRPRRRPLRRMDVDDWRRVNDEVPRIVDVLPNGPYRTSRPRSSTPPEASPRSCSTSAISACLDTSVLTATGQSLDENLDWWDRLRAPTRHAQLPPKRRRRRPRQHHHVRRPRQVKRPHQHCHLPRRKPRASRLRHKINRHRPHRG